MTDIFAVNRTLLQVITDRSTYERLRSSIVLDRFDKEIRVILNTTAMYYKEYEHEEIDPEVFLNLLFTRNDFSEEDRKLYRSIVGIMQEDADPDRAKEIIRELRLLQFSKDIEVANSEFAIGADIDLYETIRMHVESYEKDVRKAVDSAYCQDTIQDIAEGEAAGIPLQWYLKCMQGSMPDLCTGKQYIIAARPGVGKTSFMAHNSAHMLQLPHIKESGRPVCWMNNEGQKGVIKGYTYRAVLCRGFDEIQTDLGWDRAEELYNETLGGADRFRIYDIHGKDYQYIERIIDRDNPIVVVYDMLDNIRGNPLGVAGDREDKRLESLYQWARECAVKYNHLSLPTSQVSVEGADTRWVPAHALKESKTGKQGACDGIITIGFDPDKRFESSRFINIPKTKSRPAIGHSAACQTEVVFDGKTSRYLNPKIIGG